MARLARSLDHISDTYDVVIVGSGYGGGVSASRLSRAGQKVAVLERGREFLTGEFPSRFPDLKNEMQVRGTPIPTGPETALYDVRVGKDMHVLVGCGLGGGSLVNAGVALRPDLRVFDDPVWPGQIRQDGLLDEGYRRAETWLRPAAHAQAANMTKFQALAAADNALGNDIEHEMVTPRVVVSFEQQTNAAGIEQPACTLCGDCCGGCNVGAKNTVALTYLPDAVNHGAELFTHAKVRQVSRAASGDWVVEILRLDTPKGEPEQVLHLSAKTVILAAGTLGTSEILLRSAQNGLPVSSRLGERFSANGDIIAFGYGAKADVNCIGVGHPKKIEDMDIGASVSGQIEVTDKDNLDHELCVQEGAMPSALAPLLPYLFVPNGRIVGALKSLISGVYKGPFAHLQTFFAVSHDTASGKFSLKKDTLELSWPNAKDEPVYKRLDGVLEKIVTSSGGSYVKNPLSGSVMGHQPATAHPLGGCVMGTDATSGVVNHKGQVFNPRGAPSTTSGNGIDDDASDHHQNQSEGRTPPPATTAVHEGLYVIDGSVIPRSLGVNPLFTITALAERTMAHFAADHGLKLDVTPAKPSATSRSPMSPVADAAPALEPAE
ncbi:MAG: GMC family oxidoreductase N-terminal domain-containing protein [Pseudomonadota bacterium]